MRPRGGGGRAFGSFEVFFGVVHPALPSSSTEACALGGHLEMQAWFLKKIIYKENIRE